MTNRSIKELIYMYYCVNRKNSIILRIVYAAENSYGQPLFWDVITYNQDFKKEIYLPRKEVFIRNITPIFNINIRILKKEEKKYSIDIEIIRVDDNETHIVKCFIYENEIIIDLLKIKVSKDLTKLDVNTLTI